MRYHVFFIIALFVIGEALSTSGCGGGREDGSAETDSVASLPTVSSTLGIAAGLPTGSDPRSVKLREDELLLLRDAGITHLRINFNWADIEPAPGEFHFERYDFIVEETARYGIEILGLLVYGTPWATTRPVLIPGLSTVPPPDDPEDYGHFASVTARHFWGRVHSWEIWNEPNAGFRFWSPTLGGDPAQYARLLIAGYRGIKGDPQDPHDGVCEECRVLIGGTFHPSSYEFIVPGGLAFLHVAHRYTEDVLGCNLGEHYDVMTLHPYVYPPFETKIPPFGAPEEAYLSMGYDPEKGMSREADWIGAIQDARTLLAHYGLDKPIWITEFGWPTNYIWPGFILPQGVSFEDQAVYTVRALVLSLSQGVETMYLYTYMDRPDWLVNQEASFGLVAYDPSYPDEHPSPQPKHSYYAFKTLALQLGDTRFSKDLRHDLDLPDQAYGFSFERNRPSRKRVTVLWTASDDQVTEVFLPVARGTEIIVLNVYGEPVETQIVGNREVRKVPLFLSPHMFFYVSEL